MSIIVHNVFIIMEADYFSVAVKEAKRFQRPPETIHNKELTIVSGGVEICKRGYFVDRSDFPYISIEIVTTGTGELVLNKKRYSLSPGIIFSYGPKVSHQMKGSEQKNMTKYFLNIKGSYAESMVQKIFKKKNEVISCKDPLSILQTFDELIATGLTITPKSGEICESLGKILLLKLSENALPATERSGQSYANFNRCHNYIKENFLELFSLYDIAESCNIDQGYLCRLYKRYDHQTPYQHLVRLKMNHALALLNIPGKMVKEIASELGFEDPFNFSRSFKRIFGVSPQAYQSKD